eukprot:10082258-Lingulodinium_polyedra.AAC.1
MCWNLWRGGCPPLVPNHCLYRRSLGLSRTAGLQHWFRLGLRGSSGVAQIIAVSYTHLTLPTICSV